MVVKNTLKGFPQWSANIESRRKYLDYIAKTAKRRLESDPVLSQGDPSHRTALIETVVKRASEYSKQVDERYQSAGWKPVEEKRELKKHLSWSIKYQVRAINFSQIARESKPIVKPQAVIKAVRSTLAIIGLIERAGNGRGRPRME